VREFTALVFYGLFLWLYLQLSDTYGWEDDDEEILEDD